MNLYREGFLNMTFNLAARLLDPDLEGWFLTNLDLNPEVAFAVRFPGLGTISVIPVDKVDPEAGFPWGIEVEADR